MIFFRILIIDIFFKVSMLLPHSGILIVLDVAPYFSFGCFPKIHIRNKKCFIMSHPMIKP
jgi:hypothetical protein